VVVIGAPEMPHLPGLHLGSQAESSLVWIRPQTAAQALWATEQALHCRQAAAVLAWLPQAKAQALRRLQVHALQGDAPVFIFRPSAAERESSPAPLRLVIEPGQAWSLRVRLLKRRGPVHDGVIELPCLPDRLAGVLAVRLAGRAGSRPASSEQAKRFGLALPAGEAAVLSDPLGPSVSWKPSKPLEPLESLESESLESLEKTHGALAGLAADAVAELAD
jgi:hypothetical protein